MFATYLPKEHDADQSSVDGVAFKADERVDISHKGAEFVAKLRRNPWFHVGEEPAPMSEKRTKAIAGMRERASGLRMESEKLLAQAAQLEDRHKSVLPKQDKPAEKLAVVTKH